MWSEIEEIAYGPEKLVPPFVDTKDSMAPSDPVSIGTTTVPFGCTTGCPPMTLDPAGMLASAHVKPPLVETDMWSWLPCPKSSYSV